MVHVKVPAYRCQYILKTIFNETFLTPPVVLQHQRNLRVLSRRVRILIVLVRVRIRAETLDPNDMSQLLFYRFVSRAKLGKFHVFFDVFVLRRGE